MPVSIEFLRGVLGVLSLFFAHMAGRAMVAVRNGRARQSRLIAWTLRTVVCAAAVMFPRRALDTAVFTVWALAVAAFAAGVLLASRVRKEEDLTRIFPDES